MEKSDVFVLCPRHGTACDIDTCPRFLQNAEVLSSSDGKRTASGFCLERGSRYITDVPAECILDRNDAATLMLKEKDARNESEKLSRIRSLVELSVFCADRHKTDAEESEPWPFFIDLISSTLEDAAAELERGGTPVSNGIAQQWERAVPEILSFDDDTCDYHIDDKPDWRNDTMEQTLPNGERVFVTCHHGPHRLGASIERARKSTLVYLEKGAEAAVQRGSCAKDLWLKALSCYKRADGRWTLRESRPILDAMADAMVEAVSLMAAERSIDGSTRCGKRENKLLPALKSLAAVVDSACSNSQKGEFLFTQPHYAKLVRELWKGQASTDYAVARCDSAEVAELWYAIRTNLIAYAKSMRPVPTKIVRDLSSESCWLLFPKFVGVDDQPHVLDVKTLKELLATLNIADAPRRCIKPKKPRAATVKTDIQPTTVDIAALPLRAYRFAMTRDYKTIAVDEQVVPGCATEPYINLKPSAAKVIKTLIAAAGKKKSEGWVRPPKGENWRGVFQRKPYTRFRDEQLQIERRNDGLFYWRIIPNELYREHYCKTHSRNPLF